MNDALRHGGRALGFALVAFLLLPFVALAVTLSDGDFERAVDRGLWDALWLSLGSTTLAVGLLALTGTPLAWWLARREGWWARRIEGLVRLPAVTPPAVAGVALLAAFGRGGLFGDTLAEAGVSIPFTLSAVVLAQLFVAAPFFVLPVADAFREVDDELLWTARSLGSGPTGVFFRVVLPMSAPTFVGGLAMAWARALGEFGATLVFAGNLPGATQTLPVAIYAAMEGDLGPARVMALVLLAFALFLFAALRTSRVERVLGKRT
ncbi:MAG TPA: molybdate ABC transporter permease subunit [Myxococcales bacterium]|nr:molybdate ABC transporter permease subunit [Myxococcales bacterium]